MMNGFNYEQKKNIDDGITQIVPGKSIIQSMSDIFLNHLSGVFFHSVGLRMLGGH